MKTRIVFLFALAIGFSSCNDHNRNVVVLRQTEGESEVIYRTPNADFYFDKLELIEYCEMENVGRPSDFTFPQIIEYINNFDGNPVILPDTLGTKMEVEKEGVYSPIGSLIRVRDPDHPYAYIIDDIRWALIKFAKKGKLRIYHQESSDFLDLIVVEEVDTDSYAETNFKLLNRSIIFSQLRRI